MKNFRTYARLGMVALLLLWLPGCNIQDLFTGPDPPPAEEEIPPITETDDGIVESEGVVVPARTMVLRAADSGTITEVAVSEGDRVSQGAVLAGFDATDTQVAIRQAEAGLAVAQARLALTIAGPQPEEIAELEGQLTAAGAILAQATAERDLEASGLAEVDLLDAQTDVLIAQTDYQRAIETHDDTMQCFDVTRPDGTEERICPLLGSFEEQARFKMLAAEGALAAEEAEVRALAADAEAELAVRQAEIRAQTARQGAAQAEIDLLTAEPRSEARAVAEAGVQQAEAVLARAKARIERTTVEAPFASTISDLAVNAGATVAAGDPLMTLATLDHLQIQTTDLTELRVVEVQEEQAAIVTLDAMPGSPLRGRVTRIEPEGTDHLGDVVYTVVIELNESPPAWLRWGMKGLVEIITDAALVDDRPLVNAVNTVQTTRTAIAEAAAQPERSSTLQFVINGLVEDVLVSVGDTVQEGDALAYLDATDTLLAIQEAATALTRAEAELALKRAGPRMQEITVAEAQLQAAHGDLNKAVALRNQLMAGGAEAERARVQAQLDAAWAERQAALLAFDWANEGDDETKKAEARDDLRIAELKIAAAEARLAVLPVSTAAELRAANAGVASAQASVDIAEAKLALLQAGSPEAEISMAAAEVQVAEADLLAAQVALERHTLYAPFAGTVTDVSVGIDDPVGPGQVALALADLDPLHMTTVNLNELDVVHLEVGQTVQVKVDALPDRVIAGRIDGIKSQSVEYRGDVTYPLVVALDESVPELRWGMRAVVEINP